MLRNTQTSEGQGPPTSTTRQRERNHNCPLKFEEPLNVSVDSAAAGGRDPRGRLVTAHGGPCVGAEKACTGAVLVAASALPGPIPAPSRGLKPIWGSTRD